MPTVDTSELIDSAEVARLLNLSHRNSVSTYLRRYPDFPRPAVVRGDGRINLWLRAEILEWRPATGGPSEQEQAADRHRRALIDAARELMATKPVSEISIREIAERANLPHTLIYRHIGSKDDLERAVIEQVEAELAEVLATGPDPVDNVGDLLHVLYANSASLRILVYALQTDRGRAQYGQAAPAMSTILRALHERSHPVSGSPEVTMPPISPEVAVGAAAAMIVGWVAFQPRISVGTGIHEAPVADLVAITKAILDAGGRQAAGPAHDHPAD